MKYIFIDLGAYDGDSIQFFLNKAQDLPAPASKFAIYAFEPNPKFFLKLNELMDVTPQIKQISNQAAWIEDGEKQFAVDQAADPMGSTLMQSKVEIWNKSKIQTMQTFDFSDWIKQFTNDYVIVKCDCEGAEFPILYKMIQDGTLTIMDQLWCEFHPNKVREYTTTDKLELMQQIRDHGVELTEWH